MPPSFISLESQLKKEGFKYIAGIDEAGRGPLAGPVVCAAVVLKKGTKLPGLNDSKKLSAKKRLVLFELIVKRALSFSITIVPPQTIDDINILESVRFANQCCINHLTPPADYALLDGSDKQKYSVPHKTIVKGDSKIRSIAAASILAKVTRDQLMQKYHLQYPDYGFDQHMGYGTRQHRQNLKTYGRCAIHRKSFSFKV